MRDRANLFSRAHAVEFAQALAISIAFVVCVSGGAVDSRSAALVLAVSELLFIGAKTRHASRQFATLEQTEWSLTIGRFSRSQLASRYVASLLWRALYHTTCVSAAVLFFGSDLLPDQVSPWMFVGGLAAWQCAIRVAVAVYRHVAGSRIVFGFVRTALTASSSKWWRFPAQFGVGLGMFGVAIGVGVTMSSYPVAAPFVAAGGIALVFGLVGTSEFIDADTEIALPLLAMRGSKRPIKVSRESTSIGLLWFGSKAWWRWTYVPVAVVMLTLIATGVGVVSRASGVRSVGLCIGALSTLWLVSVLASSYRATWPRVVLAVVAISLFYFAVLFGFVGIHDHSRSHGHSVGQPMPLTDFTPSVAAVVLVIASLCAAGASPYIWESRGPSAAHLRALGIDDCSLRRIELATGLLLGMIAWIGLALAFGIARGSPVGAVVAATCLLLQDRSSHRFRRWLFTPRDLIHRTLALLPVLGLVIGSSVAGADGVGVPAVCATGLIVIGAIWLSTWRSSAMRASS